MAQPLLREPAIFTEPHVLTATRPSPIIAHPYSNCLLVSVAQLVERWTVAPVVEGSSPSAHPTFRSLFYPKCLRNPAMDLLPPRLCISPNGV